MSERYDGGQIVGLDLHRHRTVMVRMTPAGERLEVSRFANDPAVLRDRVAKAGRAPEVVLEATYGWYWAVDVLQDAGAVVHLAHPLGVKGFAYRRDAPMVCQVLLLSFFRSGWPSSARGRFRGRCSARGSAAGADPRAPISSRSRSAWRRRFQRWQPRWRWQRWLAHDFQCGQLLGGSALLVGPGFRALRQSGEGDHMQGPVGLAVPAAV